jgi:integrase
VLKNKLAMLTKAGIYMKMPNGYGSIRKLSGKRRKPYHVQKTINYHINVDTKKSYQERITIGYYATRQEALQALAEYNTNPYDINANKITFSEVYEKWSARKFNEISPSNINGYKASYKTCECIYNMPFVEIKLLHLQNIVDTSGKNYPTLRKLKVLLGQVFDYAVMNEIISKDRNMVEYLNIKDSGNPDKMNRSPFTKNEIKNLWDNVECNEYVSTILMLIYSGVRVSELLDLKKSDVHLDEKWFYVRHSKTNAGIRAVPIADKTFSFFEYWYKKSECDHLLVTPDGSYFQYRNYYDSYFTPIMQEFSLSHKPHDTRHTCISLLASCKVYPTTIKKIVGHAGAQTLTERVYTHLDVSELLEAINLI